MKKLLFILLILLFTNSNYSLAEEEQWKQFPYLLGMDIIEKDNKIWFAGIYLNVYDRELGKLAKIESSNISNISMYYSIYLGQGAIYTGSEYGYVFITENGSTCYVELINKNISDLPDNSVNDIAGNEADPCVCFATNKGIAKVTGQTWTVFNKDNGNFPVDTVMKIVYDNGTLYCGSMNSGLYKIDKDNNVSQCIDTDKRINEIIKLKDGRILVAVKNDKLQVLENDTWTEFESNIPDYENFGITSIAEDHKGNIWFGTKNGLYIYDGKSWEHMNNENSNIPYNVVAKIFVDKYNNKWISTMNMETKQFGTTVYNEDGLKLGIQGIQDSESKGNLNITYTSDAIIIGNSGQAIYGCSYEVYNVLGRCVSSGRDFDLQSGNNTINLLNSNEAKFLVIRDKQGNVIK